MPTQVSLSADTHGCPEHQHCNDLCSPLCGCQCCSVIFTFQKNVALPFLKIEVWERKNVFPGRATPLQDMAFAIDHPPQLS